MELPIGVACARGGTRSRGSWICAAITPVWASLLLAAASTVTLRCRATESTNLNPSASAGNVPVQALRDLDDRPVSPFVNPKGRALVFLFIRTDCPISNRYAPEIRRLASKYTAQGAAFWLIYPDAAASEIRQHLKDFQLTLPALRDPSHAFVKQAAVSVTPEAAIFSADGQEVYHGRIDNRFVSFGKERPEATEHDLEAALSAVLRNRPVAKPVTKAIGCYISEPQ